MLPPTADHIASLLVGSSGALVAIWLYLVGRKETLGKRLDAADSRGDAQDLEITELKANVQSLRRDVDDLRAERLGRRH